MAALRLVYQHNRRGDYGFFDDGSSLGKRQADVLRAKLLVEPTDALRLMFTAEKTDESATGTIQIPGQPNRPTYRNVANQLTVANRVTDPRSGEGQSVEAEFYTFTATQQVASGELKFVASHRKFDIETTSTLPPLIGYTVQNKPGNRNTALELQYNGSVFNDVVDIAAGLYYFEEKVRELQQSYRYNGVKYADRDLAVKVKSKSAYIQGTGDLAEGLNLTLGLRYTDDRKVGDLIFNAVPLNRLVQTENKLIYLATIDYPPVRHMMVYATTSTGYRSGGPGVDPNPTNARFPAEFLPEEVRNYEVGFKGRAFDRKLQLNVAAFHQKFTDYQYTAIVNLNRIIQNASAKIKGFEADATVFVGGNTSLTGSVGYVDAKVADGARPSENGFALPNVPSWTWSANLSHTIQIAGGALDLVANYSWRDRFSTTLGTRTDPRDEERDSNVGSIGLLNMPATYKIDGYSVGIFANNLTNEKYYTYITDSKPSISFAQLGLPRILGARARFEF
ncbi:MAG: TonB-dependent receptor [Sphingobium sp.]